MESRIKTLAQSIRNIDPKAENYSQVKEEYIKAYEEEQKIIALRNRCINSGAPYERIKEAGFSKWVSTNDVEKKFQSLLMSYAICLSGQPSAAQCSPHGNFVISGKSGTGKTFGALSVIKYLSNTTKPPVMIAKHDVENDVWVSVPLDIPVYRQCFYSKASKLVAIMTDRNNYEAKHDVKLGIAISDLVVIDEVGRSLQPKAEREIIFDVLDNRADNGLPTMIISNYEDDELRDFLGSAVMSRLISDCIYFNTVGIADRRCL